MLPIILSKPFLAILLIFMSFDGLLGVLIDELVLIFYIIFVKAIFILLFTFDIVSHSIRVFFMN